MDPDYFCTHRIIHGRFQSKDISLSTKPERPCAARPARSELRCGRTPPSAVLKATPHTHHETGRGLVLN